MPSDTLRQITGTLTAPDGAVYANQTLTWFRATRAVIGQGSTTVVDQPFNIQTDGSGQMDDDVMAGNYVVLVALSDGDRYFNVAVPDEAGPHNVADLVDTGPVDDSIITQVQALVLQARAWAEEAEDVEADPVSYPGEFSARHHALKAAASKTAAETAQTGAETAETGAEAAQTAAEAAQAAAELAYDNFDDRYLGAKASDPTLDNDGNALLTGALYFNTTADEMRVYTGSAWISVESGGGGGGDMLAANNLSDVASVPTSRTNLGLGDLATKSVVAVSDIAAGTDGELITWDAAGEPATVPAGTSGQVLTSNGAGAAPTFQDASGGGGQSGTSFPGTPSTNDRFYRTDRRIEYFYDGTRWLSTQMFSLPVTNTDSNLPFTSGGPVFQARAVNPFAEKYDIYVEEVVAFYILVGSGNWNLEVLALGSGGSLANMTGLTATTTQIVRTAVNAVLDNTNSPYFYFRVTENSGTASFYCNSAVNYRLVG